MSFTFISVLSKQSVKTVLYANGFAVIDSEVVKFGKVINDSSAITGAF